MRGEASRIAANIAKLAEREGKLEFPDKTAYIRLSSIAFA
jgi:hypothetical protein